MGACISSKATPAEEQDQQEKKAMDYLPLYTLKQELLTEMGFDDDHPFKIFCCWRFEKSIRRDAEFLTNITKFREQ